MGAGKQAVSRVIYGGELRCWCAYAGHGEGENWKGDPDWFRKYMHDGRTILLDVHKRAILGARKCDAYAPNMAPISSR